MELGKKEKYGEGERDAVHVPIFLAEAGEILNPGQHVGLSMGRTATLDAPHVGIVDPFLKEPVESGEHFCIMVYPGSVKKLHHEWEAKDIPSEQEIRDDIYGAECRGCY